MRRLKKLLENIKRNISFGGYAFTLKHYLNYLNVKNYMTILYPLGNVTVKVRTNRIWKLISQGEYEIKSLKYVFDNIKTKKTIIDVGGYLGAYTLFFSKIISQKEGMVYTFEPDPVAFPILSDNVNKNKLENVMLYEMALSDTICDITLISRNFFGHSGSSIIDIKDNSHFQERNVPASTLDVFCEKNDIHPDFIKMDIEGGEKLALLGAINTLKNNSLILLLELHSIYMTDKEQKDLWSKIITYSNKGIYIEGDSVIYQYGDEISDYPDGDVSRMALMF